jgi:RimJ/RimL family protein N-acetyltransferase
VIVRVVDAADSNDVATYKAVRLRALSSNPEAFGSTHEREVQFDDETWRSRVGTFRGRPGAVFVAEDATGPIGIAGIGIEDPGEREGAEVAYLWGMWVDPRARGTGTSVLLVAECVSWARRAEVAQIFLDVVRDNHAAIALYQRCGFVPTGRVGGLPSNPCAEELEMSLKL